MLHYRSPIGADDLGVCIACSTHWQTPVLALVSNQHRSSVISGNPERPSTDTTNAVLVAKGWGIRERRRAVAKDGPVDLGPSYSRRGIQSRNRCDAGKLCRLAASSEGPAGIDLKIAASPKRFTCGLLVLEVGQYARYDSRRYGAGGANKEIKFVVGTVPGCYLGRLQQERRRCSSRKSSGSTHSHFSRPFPRSLGGSGCRVRRGAVDLSGSFFSCLRYCFSATRVANALAERGAATATELLLMCSLSREGAFCFASWILAYRTHLIY